MKSKLIGWAIKSSVIVLLLVGLWLNTVPPFVRAATTPDQQVHSLVRLELPKGDLVLVVLPAQPARDGEVALWWAGRKATRVQSLISLAGYPAIR